MADEQARDFKDLLTRLVRVPKREIDEQEHEYQESSERAKPKEIVPSRSIDRPLH